ncbi:BrnT family toxin [Coleofasciculus sp.]|uniref:BrnT family toxin n=1 Tax=Coleofasciculus sp. TaxID=3100458 RepID=UPI003A3807AA
MNFDWDDNKAAINLSKHRVSFEEAKTVFDDPLYVDFYDPDHSEDEERYLIVGESNRGRLLIVSYTERGGDLIRLISARVVTQAEREAYQEG